MPERRSRLDRLDEPRAVDAQDSRIEAEDFAPMTVLASGLAALLCLYWLH